MVFPLRCGLRQTVFLVLQVFVKMTNTPWGMNKESEGGHGLGSRGVKYHLFLFAEINGLLTESTLGRMLGFTCPKQ